MPISGTLGMSVYQFGSVIWDLKSSDNNIGFVWIFMSDMMQHLKNYGRFRFSVCSIVCTGNC
jgi:hypothetical protein